MVDDSVHTWSWICVYGDQCSGGGGYSLMSLPRNISWRAGSVHSMVFITPPAAYGRLTLFHFLLGRWCHHFYAVSQGCISPSRQKLRVCKQWPTYELQEARCYYQNCCNLALSLKSAWLVSVTCTGNDSKSVCCCFFIIEGFLLTP